MGVTNRQGAKDARKGNADDADKAQMGKGFHRQAVKDTYFMGVTNRQGAKDAKKGNADDADKAQMGKGFHRQAAKGT